MEHTDEQRRTAVANFNLLSVTYDRLRFLQMTASRLAGLAGIVAGARVLDAATGTGEVVIAAGRMVGPTGMVIGLDIAEGMLEQARKKAEKLELDNVEFHQGDAQHLEYPDQSFDCVLCASGLFFMPDIGAVLKEFLRVLAPGGSVAFSTFGPSFLQPLRSMWEARLQQYGLEAAWLPTHRLNDGAQCMALLAEAGFTHVDVHSEQLGYYLKSSEQRWEDIVAGQEGKPLHQLDAAKQDAIRREHCAELDAAATELGIWVDVPAIFAFGRRPLSVV